MESENYLLELMQATETKPLLAKAIIQVMNAVDGVEKNSEIGKGANGYKGVKDEDVKKAFRKAFVAAGLCILPVDVDLETEVQVWDAPDIYGAPGATKRAQSIFTIAKTKYLLLHESGQSIVIKGVGYGIDPQDKGAGKATTYALKNTLLYSFLTPSGKIDDTDNDHSDDKETPPAGATKPTTTRKKAGPAPEVKPEDKAPAEPKTATITPETKKPLPQATLDTMVGRIKNGEAGILEKCKQFFALTPEQEAVLINTQTTVSLAAAQPIAPLLPDLGEGDLQEYIKLIAAGTPNVIPEVQAKFTVFGSQLERMRAAMPSLGETKPAPASGEKEVIKEAAFRTLAKAYKTDITALEPAKALYTFSKDRQAYIDNITVKIHNQEPTPW